MPWSPVIVRESLASFCLFDFNEGQGFTLRSGHAMRELFPPTAGRRRRDREGACDSVGRSSGPASGGRPHSDTRKSSQTGDCATVDNRGNCSGRNASMKRANGSGNVFARAVSALRKPSDWLCPRVAPGFRHLESRQDRYLESHGHHWYGR